MTKYTRLDPQAQTALLRRILARCAESSGMPAVVVFDLDGTLLENRPRTAAILREFGALVGERAAQQPELVAAAQRLSEADPSQLAYLVSHSLEALGVHEPALVEEAQSYWHARFFVDSYLHHDIEVPGAAAFARACHDAGATVVYFTGRDLPNMSLGSFQSLRDRGFPIGIPGTALVCKPAFEIPDETYKREAGPQLSRYGNVIAVFDNEPGNCNTLLAQFPDSDSVFVDTQHLPGAPDLDPRVHVLGDFAL